MTSELKAARKMEGKDGSHRECMSGEVESSVCLARVISHQRKRVHPFSSSSQMSQSYTDVRLGLHRKEDALFLMTDTVFAGCMWTFVLCICEPDVRTTTCVSLLCSCCRLDTGGFK